MSLDHELIRPIAICVFSNDNRILVAEYFDEGRQQYFYRPLGGGIAYGEHSLATVEREIKEELAVDVADLRYLGTLENIFLYNGRPGHEIVLVYDGVLGDKRLYERPVLYGQENNGEVLTAVWKKLSAFQAENAPPLYPNGLLELLA